MIAKLLGKTKNKDLLDLRSYFRFSERNGKFVNLKICRASHCSFLFSHQKQTSFKRLLGGDLVFCMLRQYGVEVEAAALLSPNLPEEADILILKGNQKCL